MLLALEVVGEVDGVGRWGSVEVSRQVEVWAVAPAGIEVRSSAGRESEGDRVRNLEGLISGSETAVAFQAIERIGSHGITSRARTFSSASAINLAPSSTLWSMNGWPWRSLKVPLCQR